MALSVDFFYGRNYKNPALAGLTMGLIYITLQSKLRYFRN